MPGRPPRKPRPPLDPARLEELALAYLGRFATTRAKLTSYLGRKLRERGWSEANEPDLAALAERYVRAGLVDDAAYAMAKSQSLSRRGYGEARVRQKLRADGVREEDGADALEHAAGEAVTAALRFAERRRFGPFGTIALDPRQRDRQIAAMGRAGHSFGLSIAILRCEPGELPDAEALGESFSRADD